MILTKNLSDFYRYNDKDIEKIIVKNFRKILRYHDIEDLKGEIYERLQRKQYIQKYRPLEITIDGKNNTWEIKPTAAKFSTYICTFLFNYIYAYYNKIKQDHLCLSLDDYNDHNYNSLDKLFLNNKLHGENSFVKQSELKIEIEKVLENLEKKTAHKGVPICKDAQDIKLIRTLDKFGKKGCSEEIVLEITNKKKIKRKELSPLEQKLFDKRINKIKEEGLIKVDSDEKGNLVYTVKKDSKRRSLHNLLMHYLEGYKDREISEKFHMTVAGIGAMKRSLRKEIQEIKEF